MNSKPVLGPRRQTRILSKFFEPVELAMEVLYIERIGRFEHPQAGGFGERR